MSLLREAVGASVTTPIKVDEQEVSVTAIEFALDVYL